MMQRKIPLESIPTHAGNICFDCGITLHDKNISKWKEYREHEGTQMAVALCIGCKRISALMLASAIYSPKEDAFVPTIDRKTAIRFIKSSDASREAWIPGLLDTGEIAEEWRLMEEH